MHLLTQTLCCCSLSYSYLTPPKQPTTSLSSLASRGNLLLSSTAHSHSLRRTLAVFRLLPARDTVTWNTALSACLRHRRPDTALRLFLHMLLSSSSASLPDSITLRAVLAACSQLRDRRALPQLHACVAKLHATLSSWESAVLDTCLLNIYSQFESVDTAHKLFVGMPHRDVVAFTSMLSAFVEAGRHAEALEVFRGMVETDNLAINEHAYSSALCACAGATLLPAGRQIHACVVKSAMESDAFVGTSLVDVYAKCDEMECARRAFAEISEPSVVSWNALMAGDLDGEECLRLFSQMRLSDMSPDHMTFAAVLRACRYAVATCLLKQLHGLVVKTMGSDELDVFVGTALCEGYLHQGLVLEAQTAFRKMKEKDDVAFNLAIQGCIESRHEAEALNLFLKLLTLGMEISEVTMTSLLLGVGGLDCGRQLHALVIKFGRCIDDGTASIISSFVRMYAEYHKFDDAIRLFEKIQSPDLVSWTSLITGFSRSGQNQMALHLYVKMIANGLVGPPNNFTFSTVLSSCAPLVAIEEGKQIHAQIMKSDHDTQSDPFVTSGLVYMYAKCAYIEEASELFDKMPMRDLASWNVMINSLAQHGFAERAVAKFEELLLQRDVEPNHITFLGVLSACSHCGMVEKGYKYFSMIEEPTIDHYTCLVDLFGRAGRLQEAIAFVEKMPFEANELIWTSLLAACSIHMNLELAEYAAKHILKLNPKDPGTYVALSNIYAAAGRWKDMHQIRKLMESQGDKKHPGVSWLSFDRKKHVFLADKWSCNSR